MIGLIEIACYILQSKSSQTRPPTFFNESVIDLNYVAAR